MTDYDKEDIRPLDHDLTDAGPGAQPFDTNPPWVGIAWGLILFLILAILVVIFSVQNTQDATLQFLGWVWELPLVIIILVTVVVSVILDEILGGLLKSRRRTRRLEKAELKRLRQQE